MIRLLYKQGLPRSAAVTFSMLFALVICALAAAATVSGQDCAHASCNIGLIHYYKELKCTPVQESGACCPSKFDCSAVLSNRARNQCHVGGRAFDIGARLTKEQTGNKCVAECRCAANGLLANLNCANIECPEHMGMRPPPGCSYAYDHEHCCSVGVICNNASRSAPFTCNHGGHSHQLAEKFYPDEKPCMACICQEGFDGTLREPWCKEISCGIEVHRGNKIHEGCAPIHYGANGCCPIDWRCPKASDTVTKSSDAATATGSAECAFGNLRLKIGDKLNSAKSCVECKCTLPPQVSCVQTGNC